MDQGEFGENKLILQKYTIVILKELAKYTLLKTGFGY